MRVKQVFEIVNGATEDVLGVGNSNLEFAEEAGEIVNLGTTYEAIMATGDDALDNFVHRLVDRIGRVQFVSRKYSGRAPSVLMDSWEFGSIREKISSVMPEAIENEGWKLIDGASYDPNIFHKPVVNSQFFNGRTTFEIDRSIADMQVKEAFLSTNQLNAFVSMLFNEVDKSLTVKMDTLIMRTIDCFIADTLDAEVPSGVYSNRTGVKAVNLLYMYNTIFGESLTADECIYHPEFIRYAVSIMGEKIDHLSNMSTVFNIGGAQRFTPKDMLHVVLLSKFKNNAATYLQSDTFHDQYVALPNADSVAYWQSPGDDFEFNHISKINVKNHAGKEVMLTGILGIMFDREALGVTNYDRRVKTHPVVKGEFTNYFYKQDAEYFNDHNENFVVFYVA